MSTADRSGLCQEVEESLSEVLDGAASPQLYDHLAECDGCRDLKHEAALAAGRVRDAGADFRPADDFLERLLSSFEAARPASSGAGVSGSGRGDGASVVARPPMLDPGGEADGAARSSGVQEGERVASVPSPSGVSATTHPSPVITSQLPAMPAAHVAANEGVSLEKVAPSRPSRTAADAPPKPVPRAAASRGKVAMLRPAFLIGAVGAMVAAAAVGFYLKGKGSLPRPATFEAPWSGSVASVARASADKTGGLDACDVSGLCSPVASGAAIRAGTVLRTDARTRAHVTLADGTDLAIDRASEIELSSGQSRAARLHRGTIVADVVHVEGSRAQIAFPRGVVEVLGTKLAITAAEDRASVEVGRGSVRLTNTTGKTVDVRAGEEATLAGDTDPVVSSSTTLADVMEWSDNKPEDVDAPLLRGLGELRAKKPGQTKEKDRAVRLARHAVKVRIVDLVARTEVDETFANDTDEELEGIFRFPLPPGAQIEKLSLEVDGKMVDGAFVDRDKGAAIWRGVIQNAAPKAPRPKEEIIWVPGPWRDPALLEWQRGGRFELKIFPIPRRGSRRVVLAYTQTVDPSAGLRRFTYPLAHDPSGSTRIGAFDLDVQVLGLDKSMGLQTRGYQLNAAPDVGERRTLHADDFVPAGDLTVEYALPERDQEVTAWAYAPATAASSPSPVSSAAPSKAKSADDKAAEQTASAILDDRSPYVAIAVRPRLPRWQEAKERLHVLVVDASRSMFGERFARATRLASAIVREMDRRDSFLLLACDTVCQPMTGEQGGTVLPEAPGAAAAGDVERFLGSIEPDGGSDLAAAMAAARTAAGPLGDKELRVLYLGDGTPSVGPTRPAHLETAVRSVIASGDTAVVAVALGADADTTSLASLARGGGGVVVPYVPGQKISTAALEVLSAAYGVVLRDPEVELPAGLSQVTPARLDPIRAGGETLLVARMIGGNEVSGTLKLKGRVAGERFEQAYPLKVLASSSAGNAFVPRMYAAAKIAELERSGGEAQKPTVIELSRRFAVASRFTSLLVLESEAMFKAFGLERAAPGPSFTGEQQAESSTAQVEGDAPKDGETAGPDELGLRAGSSPAASAAAAAEPKKRTFDDSEGQGFGGVTRGRAGGGAAGPGHARSQPMVPQGDFDAPMAAPTASPASPAPMAKSAPSEHARRDVPGDPFASSPWENAARRQRFIPMHRVFDRHVAFDQTNAFVGQNASRLTVAETALSGTPDSRDRTIELFALYSTAGRIVEAQELAAKWSGRDALDPDALQARADLAARQGDRGRAVRILGGLADLRPNDRAVQTRLADLREAAGDTALACEHRIALADIALSEPRLVAAAITCARAQSMIDLAGVLRADLTDTVREAVDKLLAAPAPAVRRAHGDVQIIADWAGGADLDLALIDAQGKRTSWLGSPARAIVFASDVDSTRHETLDLTGLPQGNYLLEITRASGRDTGDTARGEIALRLAGEARKIPFTLNGARAELGTIRVFFTSRLEPLDGSGSGRDRGRSVF